MAGTGYTSDAAAMARAISGFEESAGNVRQAMSNLESELRATLRQYSGDQARAFWRLHQRLNDDMRLAGQELDTMSRLVNESRRNYDAGDSEVAADLTTLAGQAEGGSAILSRLSGA